MVSFIIPSYNSHETIVRALESVFDLVGFRTGLHEVIVVDSSDDGITPAILRSFDRPELNIITLPQKTIPATGRNIGAGKANGDLLVFIDSDIYLDPGWLAAVTEVCKLGCQAGGGSVSIAPRQRTDMLAEAQQYLQFNEFLFPGRHGMKAFVPSCNMFCVRRLFEEAGGFPEVRASEDTLFFLKLQGKSAVWFVPQARSFHQFRSRWADLKHNQMLLGKYVAVYRRQYYQNWMYRGLIPVLLLPGFLFVKLGRIIGRIFASGPEHCLRFCYSLPVFMVGLGFWSRGFISGCSCHENS
ncbi:MAG: glycosyltransferase [Luteolibacter sp.]